MSDTATTDAAAAEPLPLRTLLDEAVRQSRRHFRSIYWPVALPLGALNVLLTLSQHLWMGPLLRQRRETPPAEVLAGAGAVMLISMAVWIVFMIGHAALMAGTTQAVAGRPVSMARAWTFVLRPRVLGTQVLAWLAFVLGLMCCVAPGVYVGLLLCLTLPVMHEEGAFGLRAFARSRELVTYNPRGGRGNDPRLKAFLVMLVGGLLGYALTLVVQLPVLIVQQVATFRSVSAGEPLDQAQLLASLAWLQVPSNLLGSLIQVAVNLYIGCGLSLLFFDLRRRKEAPDIESEVARLAAQAPSGGDA